MSSLPVVLVPGLMCSARLYGPQVPTLWQFGPVMVADHRADESMGAIAEQILGIAPPRFALIGLSMGGYIAFVIHQKAPQRVARLALLDTSAHPETPRETERRMAQIALANEGRLGEIVDALFPVFVHRDRQGDQELKRTVSIMAQETGADAFIRQQKAIMSRPDAKPFLSSITCPTLVLVGDSDALTPLVRSQEIAAGIQRANLVVVPECGHLSTLERPEAVNAALAEWMGR
ncbi:MAG TPA: alpha/beta fold hydrolase [Xanthobacteraceae bacterium]|jgi:pimeloyl-ACP methyl ester carboxylesterase